MASAHFRIEGDRGVLRDYYPSEIWWRSEDSCRELARQRWESFLDASGLTAQAEPDTIVTLDANHPHRMRTVTISAPVSR